MSRFIVAGAGHGGLVCAAKLAEKGHKVTVFEKEKEENLGHDWEDRFTFSLLEKAIGMPENELDKNIWRYRGDCAFVSPAKRKKVIIRYNDENRQRIMQRKPLIKMLVENAKNAGVEFCFGCEVISPIIKNNEVIGIETENGEERCDCVIDAAGVFSPLRTKLPDNFNIEKYPKYGDVFYAWRAYFNRKTEYEMPDVPFEVYLYHEGEQGLSWCCTNDDSVDILIGRIYEIDDKKVNEQLEIFRDNHPWLGDEIIHGGKYGVIPVRRPLTLMVADRYACVGDSAFMTTPMNGMGIDLSIEAGLLLAETLISDKSGKYLKETLWEYNKKFHILFGGDTAKNEGLKNSLLSIPGVGVDFLFENDVIQSSDLAGAGKNMNFKALMGKFVRGMRNPKYFFAIINGLIKGSAASSLYKKPPEKFNMAEIEKWSAAIAKKDIKY